MKMAAAISLANLAQQPVPQAVKRAIPGREFEFGRNYIIPTPFDPRLITELPSNIAQAAMDSGSATHYIDDLETYKKSLALRVGIEEYDSKIELAKL